MQKANEVVGQGVSLLTACLGLLKQALREVKRLLASTVKRNVSQNLRWKRRNPLGERYVAFSRRKDPSSSLAA
jgi:hypothetical protein